MPRAESKRWSLVSMVASGLALLGSCAVVDAGARGDGSARPEPTHTLVWIHGVQPPPELAPDVQQQAMAGHFTNMGALTEAGRLLLAGPLGEPRIEPTHRGLFLLATTDLDEARVWAETDPAFLAGIFRFEHVPVTTSDPLDSFPALERTVLEERLSGDETRTVQDVWQGRGYVLLRSAATAEREAQLARLRASGDAPLALRVLAPTGDELLVFLDAPDPDAAGALLGDEAGAWSLHGWYGSDVLARLAAVAGG